MLQDRLCRSGGHALSRASIARPNAASRVSRAMTRRCAPRCESSRVSGPRWGYRRAHTRLLEESWSLNRKRTQRLWREEGLGVPQRRRKRQRLGESTVPASRLRAERPDQVWALDFQYDQTADGRIIKILHVVDEFTREVLEMKCERRIDADSTVVPSFPPSYRCVESKQRFSGDPRASASRQKRQSAVGC